jgi:hypothetical protein
MPSNPVKLFAYLVTEFLHIVKSVLLPLMRAVDVLFNKHMFVRRFGMLMCFVTNGIVLWFTITRGQGMDDNVRVILVTILGLNQLYIALYQWSKERERMSSLRTEDYS